MNRSKIMIGIIIIQCRKKSLRTSLTKEINGQFASVFIVKKCSIMIIEGYNSGE